MRGPDPRARAGGRAALARGLCAAALLLLLAGLQSGCSTGHRSGGEEEPTIASLKDKPLDLPQDPGVQTDREKTIAAYRDYLQLAPSDPRRAQAMRRLGDLQLEGAEAPQGASAAQGAAAAGAAAQPAAREAPAKPSGDYQAAIALYQELLRAYPAAPDNDQVLYQLAHAYEMSGALETALATLDRLVHDYPRTRFYEEAQFRRGELMFTLRNYAGAERAYAAVRDEPGHGAFYERAVYMHGWSVYKQGRLEDALASFFVVLDLKVGPLPETASLDQAAALSRADRELVEDTLRVSSLCLENLQGAESIAPFVDSPLRHGYEIRVYQSLGEMYLAQERIKDAADTFLAFVRRYPTHAQAPVLQARVIGIYERAGFGGLALDAKVEFVERYGAQSEFAGANPQAWREQARPLVKSYLVELARRGHALAQRTHESRDRQAAAHWYRELIAGFGADPETAQANFLLAELLFEDGRYAEAAAEYERAAYGYARNDKSADAGYAALLAYARQEKDAPPERRAALESATIASALRFGAAFADDARVGAVLTNAAERLYAVHDTTRAEMVARSVLQLRPPATAEQQRVAWTVIGHSDFDDGRFAGAEQAYLEVLGRTGAQDAARGALVERLAAAVYKQGEQARAAGRLAEAVAHFERIAQIAPDSPVRATAQYDAAAARMELKDWEGAGRGLEDFRKRYPGHPLQAGVGAKLAVIYTESGQWALAAAELGRLSEEQPDAALARGALWQSAELYGKAQARGAAAAAYERYVKRFPAPFEPAIEARYRLEQLALEEGKSAAALARTRELMEAELQGGAARTGRTRLLGARAALALAEPAVAEYRRVALVEPLKKQLKLKKERMEAALQAYAAASDYGVADVLTEATYRTAELYRDFGQALLASQRPKGLSQEEREQYDVLLEEQAFPFEEKATRLHEANARHSAEGVYDAWVKSSFEALAKLQPVRYGKSERGEEAVDALR